MPRLFRELVEIGLDHQGQGRCRKIGMAEPQHLRRQRKKLAVIIGVTQIGECEQAAAHRRPVEFRELRSLGDGELRTCFPEGFDDLQAAGKAADEIRFPHNHASQI